MSLVSIDIQQPLCERRDLPDYIRRRWGTLFSGVARLRGDATLQLVKNGCDMKSRQHATTNLTIGSRICFFIAAHGEHELGRKCFRCLLKIVKTMS